MNPIKEIGRQRIKLDKLEPMPNNRKFGSGMSVKAIRELATSIEAVGIQQDLVVRPHPDEAKRKKGIYQLVIGCRRKAAADLIKLEDAPCKIVECDDAQALEIRSIENLQREGLHELEEAEELRSMLNLRDEKGQPLHTFATLQQRIGKSAAYIRARIKLLDMPELALKAFLAKGKMSASIALLICRIPDPKQAHKATVEVLDRYFKKEENALNEDIEPMSYRMAQKHIQDTYMCRLKGLPFNQEDDTLVPAYGPDGKPLAAVPAGSTPPVRCGGGKCSDCPFRTGNMKALYPDIESADVCTQTACLKKKEVAHQKREEEKFAQKGQTLLKPKQAEKVVNTDGSLTLQGRSKFLLLNEKPDGKRQTIGEILEKAGVEHEIVVAKPTDGKVKTVPLTPVNEVVVAALKKSGVELHLPDAAMSDADRQKQADEIEHRRTLMAGAVQTARLELGKAIRQPKHAAEVRTAVILSALQHTPEPPTRKAVEKMDEIQIFALLFEELVLFNPLTHHGEIRPEFISLAKEFGVDVKAIAKAATEPKK